MKISLTMIVKNEEDVLGRCLDSVKNIVDEIIIVDTGSTDKTKEIADSFGAKVYDYKWEDDSSKARNYALSKSTGDYNLVLDADEYVVCGGRKELEEIMQTSCIGRVIMINSFKSNGEISYARSMISRFFQKGVLYTGAIHEQLNTNINKSVMNIEVMHDGYLEVDKSDRNLSILYKCLEESPEDHYTMYQIAHTLMVAGSTEEAYARYKEYYEVSKVNEPYRSTSIVDMIQAAIKHRDMEYGLKLIDKENSLYNDFSDFHFQSAEFYRELVQSDVKRYIDYLPKIEELYLKCLAIGETVKYDSIEGTGSYLAAYNLGVWYEVTGRVEKARTCYEIAGEYGYLKAIDRLGLLKM